MRGFSINETSEIERKIREMSAASGNPFTSLTGTYTTGSNLLFTSGTFGEISATVGKFHILSATYHNISFSSSGSLATYNIGVFDILTGTLLSGSSLKYTSGLFQSITATVGITGSSLLFTNGTIQTLNGLSANFTFITGTNVIFTSLTGTNITGSNLFFTNGTIQNLNTLSGTINTGSFNELSSTIGRFHISSASFLLALNLTGTTLNYTNGNIQTLVSLFGNFTNLTGTNLTGSSLLFTNGTIQTLNTLNGVFTILTATNGLVTTLTGTTVNYTTGHIQTLDGLAVNYTNMTGTNQTGSSILLTSATIQKITASVGITGSGLLFTNGSIQTLDGMSANFTNITGTNYTGSILLITSITAQKITASVGITGSDLKFTTGHVQTLDGLAVNYTNITGSFFTGSSILLTSATIQSITASVGITGSTLLFTSASIQSVAILSATINTASFQELSSTIGRFHIMSASFHNIGGSSSGSAATYGNGVFDILTGTITTGSNLYFISGTFQWLMAGTSASLSLSDSFETNFGNWGIDSGITGSNSNWIRNSGTVVSSPNTGPLSASNGTYYIYPEYSSSVSINYSRSMIFNSNDGIIYPFNPQITGTSAYTALISGTNLYIGGLFTGVSGSTRNNIAVVNKDSGALGPFNPNADQYVYAMVISGSNLYLGGNFSNVSGTARAKIAIVDKDSGALGPFNPGVTAGGTNVKSLLLSGNNLYVGGDYSTVSGSTRNCLCIVNKDSGALGPFNPNIGGPVNASVNVMLLSGSNLYIGGNFTSVSGTTRNYIAVVDKDSGALGPFNPSATGGGLGIYSIVLSGSNLYIGGDFTAVSGTTRNLLAVVNKDSGALGPFNPNGTGTVVYTMALSGSNLYIGGQFTGISGSTRQGAGSVNKDSGALTSFSPNIVGDNRIRFITSSIPLDSNFYIGGDFGILTGSNYSTLTCTVDLTGYEIANLYAYIHMFGSDIGVFKVQVEDQAVPTVWTTLYEQDSQIQTAQSQPYQYINVNLTSYANKIIKVKFRYFAYGPNDSIAIDNVLVVGTSTDPTELYIDKTNLFNYIGKYTYLSSTYANLTNLTGTYITGSTLNYTTGHIQTLDGLAVNYTNMTGTNQTGSNILLTSIEAQKMTASIGITGSDLKFTTGHIQTLDGLAVNYTNITGSFFTGSSILLTSATIQSITASVGITGSDLKFTTGHVQTLDGLSVNYTNMTGTNITGSAILATTITGQNITGTIGLSGSTIQGTTLTVQTSSIYKKGAGTTIVCGNDITSLVRSAQVGITGTTLTNVLSVTAVPLGRYRLSAQVIWQADATTTGLDVAVGFSGATTKWYMEHRFASTGTGAGGTTAAASGAATAAAGNTYEAQGQRTSGSVIGSGSVSVDAVNSDTMSIIEGFFIVSGGGDITVKAAAENASLAIRVQEGTNILLHKLD